MDHHVRIFDTTLRDGMQREGLSLSAGEQLAEKLEVDPRWADRGAQDPRARLAVRLSGEEDMGHEESLLRVHRHGIDAMNSTK